MRTFYGDFTIFRQGVGKFGHFEELKLPTLAFKAEEYDGGGVLGTREISLGKLEKMGLEGKSNSYDRDMYSDALAAPGSTATWIAYGSLVAPGQDEKQLKVTWQGALMKLEREPLKASAKTMATFNWMDVIYYEEIEDGSQMFEVDTENYVLRVNGVDRFATRRRNLGRV